MSDQDQDILKLSTGVELELRTTSALLLSNAMKANMADEPRAPKAWIEDKQREEENPNDPDFIQAHQLWLAEAGIRSLKALIPTGTRIHCKPDEMVGPEDEDYADFMESMGEVAAKGVHTRYVQWVMLVATGTEDLKTLSAALMRRAGVREEDVSEAQDMFPGDEERRVDNEPSPERDGEHGDSVPADRAGAGTGD
ncbi:hypothetical protein LCGC14_2701220 [marine sediment metagenome]|uniref:Uncharacterized protein n=1 Tax=marine sediment metagenome TaxID=412755 RepID=A0A0F8ZFT4_9ZZZZ